MRRGGEAWLHCDRLDRQTAAGGNVQRTEARELILRDRHDEGYHVLQRECLFHMIIGVPRRAVGIGLSGDQGIDILAAGHDDRLQRFAVCVPHLGLRALVHQHERDAAPLAALDDKGIFRPVFSADDRDLDLLIRTGLIERHGRGAVRQRILIDEDRVAVRRALRRDRQLALLGEHLVGVGKGLVRELFRRGGLRAGRTRHLNGGERRRPAKVQREILL